MIVAAYLLLIPCAVMFFALGVVGLKNKIDLHYDLEDFLSKDPVTKKKDRTKENKITGIICIAFAIVVLLIPLVCS